MIQKKNIRLFVLVVFVACFILTAKFVSADDELTIPCGGDNQLMTGCSGDAQLYTSATAVGLANSSTPSFAGGNNSNITIINIINNIIGGGGGGGGGGFVPTTPTTSVATFSLSTNSLKSFLRQGQIDTQSITVTNNGAQAATITIDQGQLGNLVRLSDTSISLNPGQSKTITVDFIARNDTAPDLYLGFITFTSNGATLSAFTALEIESSNPLLDVAINLPFQYQQVSPGSTMLAGITLYNLGSTFGDVFLEYVLEDTSGHIILNQTDTVAIQTQTSFIKTLQIPSNAPLGDYVLYVRSTYDARTASASTNFQIVSVSAQEKIYIIIIIGMAVIIASFIGFLIIRRIRRRYKQVKKIGIEDLLWR